MNYLIIKEKTNIMYKILIIINNKKVINLIKQQNNRLVNNKN